MLYEVITPHLVVQSATFRISSRGVINDAVRFATAEIERSSNKAFYLRLD